MITISSGIAKEYNVYRQPSTGGYASFVNDLEPLVICGIINGIRPGSKLRSRPNYLLEIGTHRGAGLVNFHRIDPDMVLHSLNIPPGDDVENSLPLERIGELAKEERVPFTQHIGDSLSYPFEVAVPQVDIVFIDGAHDYRHALSDSMRTLPLVRPGRGVMIWHDCGNPSTGVLDAVIDMERSGTIQEAYLVKGTTVAFCHL